MYLTYKVLSYTEYLSRYKLTSFHLYFQISKPAKIMPQEIQTPFIVKGLR